MIELKNQSVAVLRNQNRSENNEIEFDLFENFRLNCVIRYTSETVRDYMNKITGFETTLVAGGFIDSLDDFNKSWDYQAFRRVLSYYVAKCKEDGNKPQTILNKFSALHQFFLFLYDNDIVSLNPITDFQKANLRFYKIAPEQRQAVPIEKLEEMITEGSVQTKHWRTGEFCPYKTHMLRTCYLVLSKSLLRRKEFCSLNVENFYLDDRYFMTNDHAKVSGKRRPLDDQTIWHIRVYWWIRENIFHEILTPESPAFLGMRYKTRIHPNVLLNKTKASARIVGIHEDNAPLIRRFTPHNFRHSGTTILADTEIKETYIVEIRGDVHMHSMDRYHHISTAKLIEEYLKYMPEFQIGESPVEITYLDAITEALNKDAAAKRK